MLSAQDAPSWPLSIAVVVGVSIVLFISGRVVTEVAHRCADGRIGRNGWAGIRTSATQASDEAWLVAHQVGESVTAKAGWVLAVSGPVSALAGFVGGWGDPERTMVMWAIATGVGSTASVVPLLRAALLGHRAAQRVNDS